MPEFIVCRPLPVAGAPFLPELFKRSLRCGAYPLLNIEAISTASAVYDLIACCHDAAGGSAAWGVDCGFGRVDDLRALLEDLPAQLPSVLLGIFPGDEKHLHRLVKSARKKADVVRLQILHSSCIEPAIKSGADGLVLRGGESGGHTGTESAFLCAQRGMNVDIPCWVAGAWGPETATGPLAAGIGILLDEELWLLPESGLIDLTCYRLRQLDVARAPVVELPGQGHLRLMTETDSSLSKQELNEIKVGHASLRDVRRARFESGDDFPVSVGQGIVNAPILVERGRYLAAVLDLFRTTAKEHVVQAVNTPPFAPGNKLAQEHGLELPIFQGPMTRVSDTPAFACEVAKAGGLPFVAAGVIRGKALEPILAETQRGVEGRPWGVGLLAFTPPELFREQCAVLDKFKPNAVILAGGRPDQAKRFEEKDIPAFLHVPTPVILEQFIKSGARRFIFEGRECGGHVGPYFSVVLWQAVIDVLRRQPDMVVKQLDLIFAGGIHNSDSVVLLSGMVAGLVKSGAKVGMLVGTAYLSTSEIVTTGAVTELFQQTSLAQKETAVLASGPGHEVRSAKTDYVNEFNQAKDRLENESLDPAGARLELDMLSLGRLRLAAKGVRHEEDDSGKTVLVKAEEDEQLERGLFMVGQVSALAGDIIPLKDLHRDLTQGAVEKLQHLCLPEEKPDIFCENGEPIAVIGMSAMFPKSPDLSTYWQNIVKAFQAVKELPEEVVGNADLYYREKRRTRDGIYARYGSVLENPLFDPLPYRIPPVTIKSVSPSQLLAVKMADEAIRDSGYDARAFDSSRASAVFCNCTMDAMSLAYVMRTMIPQTLLWAGFPMEEVEEIKTAVNAICPEWTGDSFPGILGSLAAGRVAGVFDFYGENLTVEAACATSLAAIGHAMNSLRQKQVDVALVGGVDMTSSPSAFMAFSRTQALSPGQVCAPFDDSADGTMLGEGAAAVVLKRLDDAVRDGDPIRGVIRGIGFSSDGRDSSMTAPSPSTVLLAMRRAYADAGYSPATVELIEAHATGTALGDRVELTVLKNLLPEAVDVPSCAIGSVKSNIGHTKVVAGLAGLTKVLAAMEQRVLPATVNLTKPNHHVDLSGTPFYINTQSRPWIHTGDHPRRAGVSSFGFGGSNYHITLEDYVESPRPVVNQTPRPAELFAWRASTPENMIRLLDRVLAFTGKLDDGASFGAAGMALMLEESMRRKHTGGGEPVRVALLAMDKEDLMTKITQLLSDLNQDETPALKDAMYAESPVDSGELCLLFPGQGTQYPGMLSDLLLGDRELVEWAEAADGILADLLPRPLTSALYPPPALTPAARMEQNKVLNQPAFTVASIAFTEAMVWRILQRFGVKPAAVAGHSFGELPALYAAGVYDFPAFLRLCVRRGCLLAEACDENPGGMAAVMSDEDGLTDSLEPFAGQVYPANFNSPTQTVLSGELGPLEACCQLLEEKGLRSKMLAVGGAFHTPLMNTAAEKFRKVLSEQSFASPRIPVYCNVTGGIHSDDVEAIRDALAAQIVQPVRFVDEIATIIASGCRRFAELGPKQVLKGLVTKIAPEATVESVDCGAESPWMGIGRVVMGEFMAGASVDILAWYQNRGFPPLSTREFLEEREQAVPGPAAVLLTRGGAVSLKTPDVVPPAGFAAPRKTTTPTVSLMNKHSFDSETNARLKQQWLELAREQQQINSRFMSLQKQLLFGEEDDGEVVDWATPGGDKVRPSVQIPGLPDIGLDTAMPPPGALDRYHSSSVEPTDEAPPPRTASPQQNVSPSAGGPVSTAEFRRDLMDALVAKTGYPEDMLDPELPLESGLGIDSIKVMELFGDLEKYHAVLLDESRPQEELLAEFVQLRTINDIINYYDRSIADGGKTGNAEPAASIRVDGSENEPVEVEPKTLNDVLAEGDPEGRRLVVGLESWDTEFDGFDEALRAFSDSGKGILILGEKPQVSSTLEMALKENDIPFAVFSHGNETGPYTGMKFTCDFRNKKMLTQAVDVFRSDKDWEVGTVLCILPLQLCHLKVTEPGEELAALLTTCLTHAAQVFADELKKAEIVVNLTALRGTFGLGERSHANDIPWSQAASLGFWRSLSKEWGGLNLKLFDVNAGCDSRVLMFDLLSVVFNPDSPREVGVTPQGACRLVESPDNAPVPAGSELNSDSVILVAGGLSGVTPMLLKPFLEDVPCTVIFAGRTAIEDESSLTADCADAAAIRQKVLTEMKSGTKKVIPAEIESRVSAVLHNREIKHNLNMLEALGANVAYIQTDVRKPDELESLVESVKKNFGKIDALVVTAGVLRDGPVEGKTGSDIEDVLLTKLVPAVHLLHLVKSPELKKIIFFGSVAGRYGSANQTDYAAANACLAALACDTDGQFPAVDVQCLDWGPLQGGMCRPELRKMMMDRGIEALRLDRAGCMLKAELQTRSVAPEVVLAATPELFGS